MEVSGQLHALAVLPPGKIPLYLLVGGWVGPRAVLDAVNGYVRVWKYLVAACFLFANYFDIWLKDWGNRTHIKEQVKL
jgi:hypothetical protein